MFSDKLDESMLSNIESDLEMMFALVLSERSLPALKVKVCFFLHRVCFLQQHTQQ